MASRKRANWEDPFAAIVLLGLLAWATAARHDWRHATILISIALIVFGWYLSFGHPHRCKQLTTRKKLCRNRAHGLLFGCHLHRWDRLKRLFSHEEEPEPSKPARARRQVAGAAAFASMPPVVTTIPAPSREARIAFWCTVLGTAAGILSLLVAIAGLK